MKNKNGYLSEQEYLSGLTMLINDKEKRIICTNKYSLLLDTYKAYDRDDDGKISK